MPEWTAFVVGAIGFIFGMGVGAFCISLFDAKNVGKLEDLREENHRLRTQLHVPTEDVAS